MWRCTVSKCGGTPGRPVADSRFAGCKCPVICVSGQLTDDEVAQVRTAASELRGSSIHVDDHPVTSMDRALFGTYAAKQGKCDLIIPDYLQLCDMKSDQKNRNREQEVAQTTRKAKLMAKELNVPVPPEPVEPG